MSAAGIFQPLPRTAVAASREILPEPRTLVNNYRASLGATLLRGLLWLRLGTQFGLRLAWERRHGRLNSALVARHLRQAIEAMGGTAVKFGQQLSNRVDLLPFEFCSELSLLTERVRPFPVAEAIQEIEHTIGGSLDTVFAAFDPDPIGSASIACVYKAVLKTGETVAVKVQRPKIAGEFAADLAIMALVTRSLELLTIARPGFFGFMRQELRRMFLEEVDFTLEARFQTLFLQYVERDRLDWVTCPRLWRQYCGPRVLVAEFVEGISCTEIIAAAETGDPDALGQLAALHIEPRRVGLHIANLGLWGYFETPFIHADPHPGNILVLPGSRLCVLDFGACSPRPRATVVHHRHLVRHVLADDISELASVAIAELAPLPHLDLDAFRRDIEARLLLNQAGLRDPGADWFERTAISLWLYLLEVTRAYGVPVNSDTLRTIRATLLYDTMAFRLNPRLGLAVTRRYLSNAPRRVARRVLEKRYQDRAGGPPGIRLLRWGMDVGWQLRRAEYRLDTLTLGIVPGLKRLAGAAIEAVRWFAAWAVGGLMLYWISAAGIAVWVTLGLAVTFGGLRLVNEIGEK